MRGTIYRILYGIAVFILVVLGMELMMGEDSSGTTQEMEAATLPFIRMQLDGESFNELHGFHTPRDIGSYRGAITPVGEDRKVAFEIDLEGSDIAELSAQLRSADGTRLIEEQAITGFTRTSSGAEASLKVSDMILDGREYMLVISLKRGGEDALLFYTRIVYTAGMGADAALMHPAERLTFVREFHEATFRKDAGNSVSLYLEPAAQADNMTLADVNIHSSYSQVTWGDLAPRKVYEPVFTMTDLQRETASFRADYLVRDEEGALYACEEQYLVREGAERMFLLDFTRHMEKVFEPQNVDFTSGGNIALGITGRDLQCLQSREKKAFAFVEAGRLYAGHAGDNTIAYVFGFADGSSTNRRELFPEHDIRILRVADSGDVDFIVYGYMNRGVHEGEMGILVCSYNYAYRTLDEVAFLPYDKSYDLLKAQISQTAFWNDKDTLFLVLEECLYAADLDKRKVEVVAQGLDESTSEVSADGSMIAWRETDNDHSLLLMDLTNRSLFTIEAPEGEMIFPLGFMEDDLVYGFARPETDMSAAPGDFLRPMYKLVIVSRQLQILEEYEKEGIYVTSCEINGAQALLSRARREEQGGNVSYYAVDNDQIINTAVETVAAGIVQTDYSEIYETVVTLSVKGMQEKGLRYVRPKENLTDETKIIPLPEAPEEARYFVCNMNGIAGCYGRISNAVTAAKNLRGEVVDSRGTYRWIFSNRPVKEQVMKIRGLSAEGETSLEKCLYTILELEGKSGNAAAQLAAGEDAAGILRNAMPQALVMDLSGCAMDTVLFYVSRGYPVIAITDAASDSAVLITGYNEREIVVAQNESEVTFRARREMEEIFARSGNRFLCYLY